MFGLLIRNLRKTAHQNPQADPLPAGSNFHVRWCGVVRMRSDPESGGLPADSLQDNSNSLQRNSDITATQFQQFQWGRRKSLLQRVKSQSNAASGRPQRKPNRSQFLGAAAAHPAAVAPAHGFLGDASDDFRRKENDF